MMYQLTELNIGDRLYIHGKWATLQEIDGVDYVFKFDGDGDDGDGEFRLTYDGDDVVKEVRHFVWEEE